MYLQNDGGGYTNGLYFGKIEYLLSVLKRYENIHNYLPSENDYEYFVKKSLNDKQQDRIPSEIIFFKIRANKHAVWQGRDKDRKHVKNISSY